ncbi:amino acid ABC transporter permease [Actinacidiphila soli]|uniref:amino acid ABC transporter permease n=1 Tax=Actinacidiphila soli TaxID=2487275 RepID=UPI000FCC5896|nr:amino acid ABC transporter permease [Actinacidiphila soli]
MTRDTSPITGGSTVADGHTALTEADELADLRVERTPRPGRWIAIAVILVLVAMLGHALVTNARFQWSVVGQYLFNGFIFGGILRTLELTGLAMLIGVLGGIGLAVARLSENPILSYMSRLYIWFFRGTPVLVQVLILFNLSALFPRLSLGIPFGPDFISGSPNTFLQAFTTAVIALGFNEAAYMAEIVRGGLLAVHPGQRDAASAIGMTRLKSMRYIVLPQAMRIIIPSTGNEVIGMLKNTSIVSVIALPELLFSAQIIYSRTYQTIPLLLVASIWYLVMTTVLTLAQTRLERHYGRSDRSTATGVRSWSLLRSVRTSMPNRGATQ